MIIDTHPPIEIPFDKMTRAQKIALRDALLEDLSHEDSESEPSVQNWHFDVLAERERRLNSGEAKLLPLNEFLAEMRKTLP